MNLKTYDSTLIAKYLIALAFEKGIILNVTKVQKMLYIAYGFYLASYNHTILDEQPKAWPFGPVFPKTRKKERVDYGTAFAVSSLVFEELHEDEELRKVLINIINKYSKYSASQLSEWSHMNGGPWEQTTKQNGFDWNNPIPDSYIKNYFKELNV
jgi:uncharacterized phage-associated protein